MRAPSVAQVMVTVCLPVKVPPFGSMTGAAADCSTGIVGALPWRTMPSSTQLSIVSLASRTTMSKSEMPWASAVRNSLSSHWLSLSRSRKASLRSSAAVMPAVSLTTPVLPSMVTFSPTALGSAMTELPERCSCSLLK